MDNTPLYLEYSWIFVMEFSFVQPIVLRGIRYSTWSVYANVVLLLQYRKTANKNDEIPSVR